MPHIDVKTCQDLSRLLSKINYPDPVLVSVLLVPVLVSVLLDPVLATFRLFVHKSATPQLAIMRFSVFGVHDSVIIGELYLEQPTL